MYAVLHTIYLPNNVHKTVTIPQYLRHAMLQVYDSEVHFRGVRMLKWNDSFYEVFCLYLIIQM